MEVSKYEINNDKNESIEKMTSIQIFQLPKIRVNNKNT